MKIKDEILDILSDCRTEGNTVFLPERELERNTYLAVNKCLENIGGKWNRKSRGHVFDYDPAEALENLVLTGETEDMKKTFQFFPTPREVAEIVCDLAEIDSDSDVLEPSIGCGDLADAICERRPKSLYGVEINPDMERYLSEKPYDYQINDFLDYAKSGRFCFNRVIMNPPFSRQQDIDHIRAAFGLLQADGILVSVMSVSPFFRSNNKSVEFCRWLQELDAEVRDMSAGAFKVSGTMIPTKIIKIRKRVDEE